MKRALSWTLILIAAFSLAWVAAPLVLIWPFRRQTPAGLAIGRFLILWGFPVAAGLLALGALAALLLWPRLVSWIGRTLAGAGLLLLAGCAWFSWGSHFESMFHPLARPRFAQAADAKEVADADLVLGVQAGGQARAYPVRELAYHHLVNDVIAGEAIVATY